MSSPCEPAVLEFPCAAAMVWQAFCDSASYERWYGFPNPHALCAVEPEFSLGAKLTFDGMASSTIVTVFNPGAAITLSTGTGDDAFTLAESERGCRVTLVSSLNGKLDWHGTAKAKSRTNKEILRALRTVVCEDQSFTESEQDTAVETVPREQAKRLNLVSQLFYGYKNPLKRRRNKMIDDSVALSNIVDNTEGDVVVHLRAAIVCILLAGVLFAALGIANGFERSDIVTSSGLSVVESYNITLENAQRIAIGQSKTELELMLSCRGTRVTSTDYIYYSAERSLSGTSLAEIHVTYDAYGNVRRFGYIDHVHSGEPLPIPIADYTATLNTDMTPQQAGETLGAPVSAFWHDKSGETTVFFGILDTARSLYDGTLTSELVVQLDANDADPVRNLYYYPYNPRNTLPFDNLDKQFRRQYSNVTNYRADRAAYERIFLLVGLERRQVDAILGTDDVEYAPAVAAGTLCFYQTRNLFTDDEAARYRYTVTYGFEDIAQEVAMQNGYLEARENTLLDYDSYAIYEGSTLFELYSTMGLLPTYVVYDGVTLLLCYGQRAEGRAKIPYLYDLTVELDAATMTVTGYSFNHA